MIENSNYCGWRKWCPTAEEWEAFEVEGKLPFELLENEYLLIYEDEKYEHLASTYCWENSKLRKVARKSIVAPKKVGKTKAEEDLEELELKQDAKSIKKAAKLRKVVEHNKKEKASICPRNDEQICAIDLLKDRNKPVKVLLGGFGTGKTYLAVAAALEALNNNEFDKIIWIRNTVRVAGTPDIGALPGTELDKIIVYASPMIDHVGKIGIETMLKRGILEIEALQFLRGRNLENSIIICDECENLTLPHVKLLLGRIALGSEIWFLGDVQQKDLKLFEESKGIENLIENFKGNKLFSYAFLRISERSEVAKMADELDKIL